jgi:hypothetical protein
MDKETLQRVGWTVTDLRAAVTINERGIATQGVGAGDVAATATKVDRAVRSLDRVGRALHLGSLVGVAASARGASAFIQARDRSEVVGLLGGEVRDVESTLATIGELLSER